MNSRMSRLLTIQCLIFSPIFIEPGEPGSLSGAEFYEAVWAIATTRGGPSMRGTIKGGPQRPIDITGAAGEKVPFDAPGGPTR
jgi:hypothetical protein